MPDFCLFQEFVRLRALRSCADLEVRRIVGSRPIGPAFHFETRNVRCVTNVLGVKGAGEAGTIGAAPAVMNAIGDASYNNRNFPFGDLALDG